MIDRLYEILMDDDVTLSINNNIEELLTIIPELKASIGFKHNHPYHHLDVWGHTLYALSFAPKDYIIRISLLLHDIGKPFVCTEKDGIRHFYGHPDKSCEMTYDILSRLGYDESFIELVCYLVRYHDIEINEEDIKKDRKITLLRYIIQYCDSLAHNPNVLYKKEKYLDKVEVLIDNYQKKNVMDSKMEQILELIIISLNSEAKNKKIGDLINNLRLNHNVECSDLYNDYTINEFIVLFQINYLNNIGIIDKETEDFLRKIIFLKKELNKRIECMAYNNMFIEKKHNYQEIQYLRSKIDKIDEILSKYHLLINDDDYERLFITSIEKDDYQNIANKEEIRKLIKEIT